MTGNISTLPTGVMLHLGETRNAAFLSALPILAGIEGALFMGDHWCPCVFVEVGGGVKSG